MYKIYFDGGCIPTNPGGVATYGYIVKLEGNDGVKNYTTDEVKGCGIVGKGKGMTSNVAEYTGLIEAIRTLNTIDSSAPVEIYGDSKMVINMASKVWGWKKGVYNPHPEYPHLKELLDMVFEVLGNRYAVFQWIPREQNRRADKLTRTAYAEYLKEIRKNELVKGVIQSIMER